jgi:uncharacterized protein YegP (UPF0339 family)
MAPSPRFELIRDDKGIHARFWSGTRIIWWTESYQRKADAINAIHILERNIANAPIVDLT